jgi:exoribonuclease R
MKSTKFNLGSTTAGASEKLTLGFTAIAAEFQIPQSFPPEVDREAAQVTSPQHIEQVLNDPTRTDLLHLDFVTLDPASSTDLDQAFALNSGEDGNLILHYAIADVGAFVPRGSAIEAEALRRGETIYSPQGRTPQYPESISEQAASLLPDGPRPAIVLEVGLDPDGNSVLRSAKRSVVRSRAKLAYETVDVDSIELLREFARRIAKAESGRNAMRADLPEQELNQLPNGHFELQLRSLLESENVNAALSLAANLAVGDYLANAGVGLFRVMDTPDDAALSSLRRLARALRLDWSPDLSLGAFQRSLDVTKPTHRAFLVSARRAGGGASYATLGCGDETAAPLVNGRPFHGAIAGTYAHATAPLRRLADRYVLELLCTLFADGLAGITQSDRDRLASLPAIMRRSAALAGDVERAAVDLAETVLLHDRVTETFIATVLESSDSGAVIQLLDPPVRARLPRSAIKHGAKAGAEVTVRLVRVDVAERSLKFEVASNG